MMSIAADILSWGLIILGSVSMLIGGIGVLRFPAGYTCMHAASITYTMGAGALLLGLTSQAGFTRSESRRVGKEWRSRLYPDN